MDESVRDWLLDLNGKLTNKELASFRRQLDGRDTPRPITDRERAYVRRCAVQLWAAFALMLEFEKLLRGE